MRYLGNKENIIARIHSILSDDGVSGTRFFDFFSGTTNVAKYYKRLGYEVNTSDIMYLSYCLQKAYIEANAAPTFTKLLPEIGQAQGGTLFADPLDQVIASLNSLKPVRGFVYSNYTPGGTAGLPKPRMYFSDRNGAMIDAIRQRIEYWNGAGLLTNTEYHTLLACLIESVSFYANVAGIYAAFYKKWDPRAVKPLQLRRIEAIESPRKCHAHYGDSMEIAADIDTDILYLDPPYNERQYMPNYHLLETIARYDSPQIHGVTGMRPYDNEKSEFCNSAKALAALDKVARTASYRFLVLSYNSEGIMPQPDIISTLSAYGSVRLEQFEYARFKSNNNGLARTKKTVFEQLYILTRHTDTAQTCHNLL